MPNLESESLLVMIGGLLGTLAKGLSQFLERILVLGSASVALGQDSTLIYSHPNWKQHKRSLEIEWSNYCTLIHWSATQQIGIKY